MEEKRRATGGREEEGVTGEEEEEGRRKIGAREGETENDEGGMGRAGSHGKGMLSGTYV